MNRIVRTIVLYATTGIAWCGSMRLFFVASGAQSILADPARQSSKFLKVFMEYPPLPRMAADAGFVWVGFFICGLFAATAFLVINVWMKGGWIKRGLTFGLLHWLMMIPWFEFYLPYNVMHEPLPLVLLEGLLWLATLLLTGLYVSLVMNFSSKEKPTV